jgi:hypothetical protein
MSNRALTHSLFRWRDHRRAIAIVCLALVCFFAGVAAVHQHALPSAGTSITESGAPGELCAVAFQAAIVFAIQFLLLHVIRFAAPAASDPKSKSKFRGTSIFFRPPPFVF